MIKYVFALAATTILTISTPVAAQNTPAFRVPMGAAPSSSTVEPTYAWLESLGNCSTTCGTGTRTTSYQCQNVADYDYSGGGYGLPEPDSACTASAGPKPASTNASCTVYSGCGYDWVKPPVTQTPIPLDANPTGRLGCGYVKTVFSPYCQRTGGGSNVVMASGDYRFCSGDRPDYDPVAAGDPDALGYDRNVTQVGSCNTSDHDWRPNDTTTGWGSWSSQCDSAATRTRAVSCYRRFDGTVQADTSCAAASRPESSQTAPQYASCSYSFSYGAYGAWSSGCDTNATRTRTATCMRSNNGGQAVPDAECTSRGIAKEATSETSAQYDSCSYAFQPTAWSGWSSGCDANATRSRTAPCVRSNNGGQTVADTECTNRGQAKPATSETGAQYGSCSYSFTTGSWSSYSSSCSNSATRTRSVTCTRSNNGGAAVADSECTSRGVAQPASSESSAQYGGCSYSAVNPGGWSGWASGCSASTTRTRQYQCLRSNDGGQIVADGECTGRGVSLTETQSGANYASCSYSWQAGGWSSFNSGCSASATRTRSVWCARDLDGATVADGNCNAGTRPAASETAGQYGSCSYGRGAENSVSGWNSACSGSAQRTHYYNCNRSDGSVVASSECTGRGISVSDVETAANYSGCTYSLQDAGVGACQSNNQAPHYWRCIRNQTGEQVDSSAFCGRSNPTYDACSYYSYSLQDAGLGACQTNNQAPHYWRCIRNPDGAQVDSATYCGRSNPTYESCSYQWTYRLQDAGVGACQSNNQAPHYWTCIREQDGAQVDSATYCGRPNPTYDACSYYSYSLQDAGLGACQTNNQAPHYWRCVRNPDGAQVDSATYCGRSNPTYEGCSFQWTYRLEDAGTGACQTNNQAPHYWRCIRNEDGTQVDSATYCGRGNPTYDSCSYPWGYTPNYGGWSACPAGANQQQTRTMSSCTRSDGTSVATSYCTGAGHPSSQSQTCDYNPGGNGHGFVLGTYAFNECTAANTYPNGGTMPGVNPAQCRSGQATYARKCTNGGNSDSNAACNYSAYQNNPRGPSGYPCDVICN
jgi:hypothetical protein